MALTVDHQLMLLVDILTEHTEDGYSDINQYQQIKRLANDIMIKNSITSQQLIDLLPEIYNYGQHGVTAENIENHISANVDNINAWKNIIEETQLQ